MRVVVWHAVELPLMKREINLVLYDYNQYQIHFHCALQNIVKTCLKTWLRLETTTGRQTTNLCMFLYIVLNSDPTTLY